MGAALRAASNHLRRVLSWGTEPAAKTQAPFPVPEVLCLTVAPNQHPEPQAGSLTPKRRRKPIGIVHIYQVDAKPEAEAKVHARAVFELMLHLNDVPGSRGKYVLSAELQRMYESECRRNGWEIRHWTGIARHLAKLTKRTTKKIDGRKHIAYRSTRAVCHSLRYFNLKKTDTP